MSKLFIATLTKVVESKLVELDSQEEAEKFSREMYANWGYDMTTHNLVVTETEHFFP